MNLFSPPSLTITVGMMAIMAAAPNGASANTQDSVMYRITMPLKLEAHLNGLTPDVAKITSDKIKRLTRQGGVVNCDPNTGLAAGEFHCKNMDLAYFLTGEGKKIYLM